MIQAVLWDFGGVFTASPFHAGRRFAASQGVDSDALISAVLGPYHADTDHPWHRVERGELAMAVAFEHIQRDFDRQGFAFSIRDFFSSMGNDGIDRAIVAETVRSLRSKGLLMGIITNNAKEFEASWRRLLPLDELFHDVVDSSQVGVRKPNPAIYELALRRLGLSDPDRAVFLDDFEPNVIAARSVGLHGIVVGEDPRDALMELASLLDD